MIKSSICSECYCSFISNRSKIFCDVCTERLGRDIDPDRSVEDIINERKFI